MATRQKIAVAGAAPQPGVENWGVVVPGANGGAFPLDTGEDEFEVTPADRIATMLQDYGDVERAIVKLFRVGADGKFPWCADYAPGDFEAGGLTMIRDQWGAGEYQIRLYGVQPGSNAFNVRARQNVTIEAMRNGVAFSSPSAPHQQTSELSQVLAMLATGQRQLLEAVTSKAPEKSTSDNLKEMLGMMTLMREAMGINGKPAERTSIGEIVDAIKELKGAKELIDGESKEPAGDPSDPMTMLPQILSLVQSAMQQKQQAPDTGPIPMLEAPAAFSAVAESAPATPSAPDPQQPVPEESGSDMNILVLMQFMGYLKELLEMAVAGKSSADGAALIYEKLPDEMVDMLAADGWWQELASVPGVLPLIGPHQAWLTETRDAALKMFDESPVVEETAAEKVPK